MFAGFAALVYLFPYTGDDWAWGSEIGIERLKEFFYDYNGRYAGNLLVIMLTRSKAVNMIFTAFSMLLVCVLPAVYAESKKLSSLIITFAMIVFLPRAIWVQSVAWTAGFSNYVPPMILAVVYLIITKNVFGEEKPQYGKFAPVVAAVIAFISSLFMENVTLYCIILSVGIIVFTFKKHKCFCATHFSHLFGTLAGTVLMFSNKAYFDIASGNDGYRSTAASEGIFETLKSHIRIIAANFFVYNLFILTVLTVLCALLVKAFIKQNGDAKTVSTAKKLLTVNVFCFALFWLKLLFRYVLIRIGGIGADSVTNYFIFAFAVVYFLTVCAIIIICVKNEKAKCKMMVATLSVPILIGPMLVVNPIGPRCFFPPYVMMAVLVICLYDYICDFLPESKKTETLICSVSGAASAVMLVYLLGTYGYIHHYDMKRIDYIRKQAELGCNKVVVCAIPKPKYVHCGDPDEEPWDERYKLFYGIDEDIEFKMMPHGEFDEWAKDFDEKENLE